MHNVTKSRPPLHKNTHTRYAFTSHRGLVKNMLDLQPVIGWFILQPLFVQLAASLIFFLLIAPGILTAVAIGTERLEPWIASAIVRFIPGCTQHEHFGVGPDQTRLGVCAVEGRQTGRTIEAHAAHQRSSMYTALAEQGAITPSALPSTR